MGMNFKEVFKGFKEATPDGKLPKLNSVDPVDMSGGYRLKVVKTDTFESQDSKSLCFRAEFEVITCSNGKLKPGAHCAFIQHGVDDKVDYMRAIAFGNIKGFLAAAMTYMVCEVGDEFSPIDESLDWLDWVSQSCEQEDFLTDAIVDCTVINMPPSSKSKTKKPFGKATFSCVEERAAQAA